MSKKYELQWGREGDETQGPSATLVDFRRHDKRRLRQYYVTGRFVLWVRFRDVPLRFSWNVKQLWEARERLLTGWQCRMDLPPGFEREDGGRELPLVLRFRRDYDKPSLMPSEDYVQGTLGPVATRVLSSLAREAVALSTVDARAAEVAEQASWVMRTLLGRLQADARVAVDYDRRLAELRAGLKHKVGELASEVDVDSLRFPEGSEPHPEALALVARDLVSQALDAPVGDRAFGYTLPSYTEDEARAFIAGQQLGADEE